MIELRLWSHGRDLELPQRCPCSLSALRKREDGREEGV